MSSRYAAVHANPNGPGDARPTALQIIADEGVAGAWPDKTILITGCSSGLGVETAKALYETGATLYLTARNLNKARGALGELASSPRVHLLTLDLDSLASVRAAAADFLAKSGGKLNVLVANAGVMATPQGRTADGFETQLGTNHLAHFLLINLLAPALLASTTPAFPSRVVILSSVAHHFSSVRFDDLHFDKSAYDPWVAYGQSKTANLWTAAEIERRYGAKGLHAWSVQPGGVATELIRHLPEEAIEATRNDPGLSKVFKSPEQGAATSVLAAVSKELLDGNAGKYLEDCQVAGPWDESSGSFGPGYAKWAYEEEGAKRLWEVSEELVGLKKEA